ncbi:SdiA-regulated superfamily protein [Psychroflexus sp. YR1-1]|uniref:SdiA-regulated superfamily protein n=1 Tax=Psychroflexus aurantiacus TaxID=2709310 RepID=A0A6B3R103_9FLAO|nr:SdiA-regulated domain-containing protein [Psychroflexus aurantiacus]NEV94296.1 SdiA-regulated superfamily protein [Psychroflexus aurantiacus]
MKENLYVIFIIGGILLFAGVLYVYVKPDRTYSRDLIVLKTWELPDSLREISGISHLSDSKMACIQDEEGIIFIYDLNLGQVINEIKFGPSGDYESIRVLDSTAFIMESNGRVYKVSNFESDRKQIEEFTTQFKSSNDMESLDFHPKTNSFLTIPKEKNLPKQCKVFSVYKMNAENFKIAEDCFLTLTDKQAFFKTRSFEIKVEDFHASELSVHPQNGEIFILSSKPPKLLVIGKEGLPKEFHLLNPKHFQQPEGLSFDSKGRMYISNEEGNSNRQNIQLVEYR